MNLEKNNKNKGFTLIELLVVVAIIGLLSSIILASVNSARKKAIDTKIMAEYNQLKAAFEIYYAKNGKYPEVTGNTPYCIGSTQCVYGNNSTVTAELASVVPDFTYKPETKYIVKGQRGFIYLPAIKTIMFATEKTGYVDDIVGVWNLTVSVSSN